MAAAQGRSDTVAFPNQPANNHKETLVWTSLTRDFHDALIPGHPSRWGALDAVVQTCDTRLALGLSAQQKADLVHYLRSL